MKRCFPLTTQQARVRETASRHREPLPASAAQRDDGIEPDAFDHLLESGQRIPSCSHLPNRSCGPGAKIPPVVRRLGIRVTSRVGSRTTPTYSSSHSYAGVRRDVRRLNKA